jgi:PAS domain-containing protein
VHSDWFPSSGFPSTDKPRLQFPVPDIHPLCCYYTLSSYSIATADSLVLRLLTTTKAIIATAARSDMQPTHDNSLLGYVGEGRTEAEVAAMDDMQFMDALLEHESSFVDTSEPVDPSQLSPMDDTPAVSNSSLASSSTRLQQQGVVAQAGLMQQQAVPPFQEPAHAYQQLGSGLQMQQPVKVADVNSIAQSTLTARLNYPFALAPSFPGFAAPMPVAPSVSSGNARRKSTTELLSTSFAPATSSDSRKRSRESAPPISEDEGDKLKRRMDRNQREQQRSQKITEQIACLKELLAAANVHFKPDKHSTLITVADYIKQLQARSQLLDSEHQKLLDTIAKTSEIASSPQYQTSAGNETVSSNDLLTDAPTGLLLEDEHAVFVKGLDYRNIFKQCSIPLAVASIDGRLMDCNGEFEALTGYERDELLLCEVSNDCDGTPRADVAFSDAGVPSTVTTTSLTRNLSLFNLLCREDMEQVFLAMSRMLKQPISLGEDPPEANSSNRGSSLPRHHDFWSGRVNQSRRMTGKVSLSKSLALTPTLSRHD